MDDGVVLSASVRLPNAPGRWSAILDAVPYRKDDDFRGLDERTYAPIAAMGFACVRLDLRGSGSSLGTGEGEYLERELVDLEQAIALIAAEPWCTGRVGMTGVSWGGFNAIQVAMRRPEALRAIAPIHFSVDRYRCDVHYAGGSLQVHEAVSWPGSMVVENAMPPDPSIVGGAWEAIWRDRLERTPQWPLATLAHQRRDAYWRHGSACEQWRSIAVPVLAIGGWRDGYRDACLAVLRHVDAPRRAVIGPWGHARPFAGAPGPALDHRHLLARWFDRWLNDVENGVDTEPTLVAWQGGRWRAFRSAPDTARSFALVDEALTPQASGGSPRSWAGPVWVGHGAPWWCPNGAEPLGRESDMRRDDAASLCYDTPPLPAPLELLGGATATLTVVVDRPVAQVAARIEHVSPDGFSTLLARGGMNLTRCNDAGRPRPVVPGEPLTVSVAIAATGATIPAGHRLRLAIAGADWPIMWPAPEPFTLTVTSGTLALTVVDPACEVGVPAFPLAPDPPIDDAAHDDPETTWTVARDHTTGAVTNRTTSGWRTTYGDGVLSAGSEDVSCSVLPDGTCTATARHTAEVRLGPAHARAASTLAIRSDPTTYHLSISLDVERDGAPVFARAWAASVARDLM